MIYKSNSDRLRLIPLTPIRKGEYATRLSTKGTCFLWKNDRAPEEEVEAEDMDDKDYVGVREKISDWLAAESSGTNCRRESKVWDEFQV
jgi:hypothetical protein